MFGYPDGLPETRVVECPDLLLVIAYDTIQINKKCHPKYKSGNSRA